MYFFGIVVGVMLAVVIAIAILFLVTKNRPDSYSLERKIDIPTTTETIYPLMVNLKAWEKWSPWEDVDPNLSRTYEAPDSGVGAVYMWQGNQKAGAGRMEITEAIENESVAIRIDFLKPMKATNHTELKMVPLGSQTQVVWTMTGETNTVSKMMSVFMDMEKMIGPDLERGLENLKTESTSSSTS